MPAPLPFPVLWRKTRRPLSAADRQTPVFRRNPFRLHSAETEAHCRKESESLLPTLLHRFAETDLLPDLLHTGE